MGGWTVTGLSEFEIGFWTDKIRGKID